jgi:hypothetical protein
MPNFEQITILEKPRKLTIEERPLDSLRLDQDNPRFRHTRVIQGLSYTDEQLDKKIWEEDDTKELYNSIKAAGGLTNNPFIKDDGLVIEGNRRIVCLRHLAEQVNKGKVPEFKQGTFDRVLVKVLPPEITQVEIDIMLAREHVTGKKEWAALNQAEHIYKLIDEEGMSVERVADLLGKSKPFIYQKKYAYEQTLQHLKLHPNRTINDFSFFEEAYKKKKDIQKLGVEPEKLSNWIASDKFNDEGARDLRELPKVLESPQALKAFESKGMKEANFELAKHDPTVGSETFTSVKDTITALRRMPRDEYDQIPDDPNKVSLLKELDVELHKVFRDFSITVEARQR